MKKVLFIILGLISVVYSSATDKIDVEITYDTYGSITQNSVGLLEIPGWVKLKNLNTKTIKYMTLEMDAYNSVGDLLTPYPGASSCRVTGPISYNQHQYTEGCIAYYGSGVAEIKVRVSNVEYMDGTINNNPTDYYIVNAAAQNRKASEKLYILMGVLALLGVILQ